jgi:hypothetical protein
MVSHSISKLVAQPEPAASTEGKARQWYFSLLACFLAKPSPVAVVGEAAVAGEVAAVADAAVAAADAVVAAADAVVAAAESVAVAVDAAEAVAVAAPAAEDEQDPEEDDLCLSSSSSE